MADIPDSTAPIGCQSCFCDEAATPSANEGQMQLSIQAATGRRGRPPFIPHCDGSPLPVQEGWVIALIRPLYLVLQCTLPVRLATTQANLVALIDI
uniref:Uncharacterized protein n=1 Tax=Oryza nivara TaxID=4536 RepID=A0A0E0J4F5_ORYNI